MVQESWNWINNKNREIVETSNWKHVNKIIGSRSHGPKVTGLWADITGPEMVQELWNWINSKNRDMEAETLKREIMEAWNYGHRKSIYFSFCHGSWVPKIGLESHKWSNYKNGANRLT
jgi:hypothetical protein